MAQDHPLGYTNFELRELAGHPHAWEETDEVLAIEFRLPDYPDWVVTSRFQVIRGDPVLVEVSVGPASLIRWPPSTPLNHAVIRSIKTSDLLRRARRSLKAGPSIGIGIKAAAAEFHRNPRPGKARRSDLFYANIAARYLQLVSTRTPTKRLAEELSMSQSQARDLIHEARRRQLLTTTKRGEAGGDLTQRALQLLANQER